MVKQLEYRIERDDEPGMHPRTDMDNLGTMHCWHSQYNLGDEQHTRGTSKDFFLDMVNDKLPDSFFDGGNSLYDLDEKRNDQIQKLFDKTYIYLPLYLYDHSGITMNTGGFSCQWDSGQVGWIIVSKEKVRKECDWKVITKKRIQQIEGYLRGEVETYDQYLTGDIWGFIIEDEEYDIFNSCWGFYGEEYCKQEAQSALEYEQEQLNKKLKVVPRDVSKPEWNWKTASDIHLDAYLMELWPNECRELDAIFERGKENKDDPNSGIVPDDEIDRFYELNDFLKESMKGSISRYFSPRRTA